MSASQTSASQTSAPKVLVFGIGTTGRAIADALVARGYTVLLADDAKAPPTGTAQTGSPHASAAQTGAPQPGQHAGIPIRNAVTDDELRQLVASVDAVSPSPGVPAHHLIYQLAKEFNRPIWGDFDLAARWDSRPIAAITGTNGKTTVTTLSTAMLVRSGISAVAAGNTEVPLVAAIDQNTSAEVFVVEASSFRLATATEFAPRLGAWLNIAPDHLDWHGDMRSYESAKARIWRNAQTPAAQTPETQAPETQPSVAVYPFGDKQIAQYVPADSKKVTFAAADSAADVTVVKGNLSAFGRTICPVADMALQRPHNISNAAAATAIALEMGASDDAVAAVLAEFQGLPHRLQKVTTANGVTYYNDSKATTPQAVLAGMAGFENAVLIAGGRNKGVSLQPLQALASRLLAVVAIGEASQEIADVFQAPDASQKPDARQYSCRVEQASNMAEAVKQATEIASSYVASNTASDTASDATNATTRCVDVVLSPACASFDWYNSYEQRGDDFVAEVARVAGASPTETSPAKANPAGANHA